MVPGSQPGQGQCRVFACNQRQVELGGLVLQDEFHRFRNGRLGEQVIIVEHQHQRIAPESDLVEQSRQDFFDRRKLRRLESAEETRPGVLVHRLQGRRQVGQKAQQIVIAFVQGEPRCRITALLEPGGSQRGLPKPGGSGDERQSPPELQPIIHLAEQVRARHQVRPQRRDIEFSSQRLC